MAMTADQFKRDHLHGVWPAIPLPWCDDDSLDDGLLRELVLRYKSAGADGVYTTGTDGELSALDFDDFAHMVDVFAAATQEAGLPAQVGCTWLHTKGVLQRVDYAVSRGLKAVQISQPFWTPLTRWPSWNARRATALIAAFRPGASPPPVRTPIRTGIG